MDVKTLVTTFEYTAGLMALSIIVTPIVTVAVIAYIQKLSWITRLRIPIMICTICLGFTGEYFLYERLIVYTSRIPAIAQSVPSKTVAMRPSDQHLTITFDAPVLVPLLTINSTPKTRFRIEPHVYVSAHFPFAKTITLIPETSFPPGEHTVMVYIANIHGLMRQQFGGEQLVEFVTPPVPNVVSVSPPHASIDIPINPTISIELSAPADPSSIWEISSKPAAVFKLSHTNGATLTVEAEESLQQGTVYELTLQQTPIRYNTSTKRVVEKLETKTALSMQFTTRKPALVTSFTPRGRAIAPHSDMAFVFDEPMDTRLASASISPYLQLTPSWTPDGQILRLIHQPFTKGTSYTVTLDKNAQTLRGGTLLTDAIYTFETAGPVTVIEASPAASFSNVPITSTMSYTFDQDVHKQSVEKLFSISPDIPGTFTWDTRTVTYVPKKPLSFSTTYTVTFKKGLSGLYGLESSVDQKFSFTTVPEEYVLNVPFYKQQELFTCNIAAAFMLLSYRGVAVTERILKETIGSAGTRGNGNPYKGYVANYGTYWDAVARGTSKYRPVRIIKNWTLQQILSEIVNNTPVMIWGQNGWSDPHEISWKTSDGTDIYAVNGMHSYIIRGFRGPIQSPTHILVVDPWRGIYAMTTEEFMRHASFFKVAMAVD